MNPTINVELVDFHGAKNHEMVIENEDGSYTVLIDSRLSSYGRLDEYKHAVGHINGDDYEKPDVQKIESHAHGLPQVQESIPAEKVPDWLKSLRKDHNRVKKALLAYDRRRKFME